MPPAVNFKTGRAGQPPAWKVRFLRRVVPVAMGFWGVGAHPWIHRTATAPCRTGAGVVEMGGGAGEGPGRGNGAVSGSGNAAGAKNGRGGESITFADVKVGDSIAGQGALKNGVFVPAELGVMDPTTMGQRKRRGGDGNSPGAAPADTAAPSGVTAPKGQAAPAGVPQ